MTFLSTACGARVRVHADGQIESLCVEQREAVRQNTRRQELARDAPIGPPPTGDADEDVPDRVAALRVGTRDLGDVRHHAPPVT